MIAWDTFTGSSLSYQKHYWLEFSLQIVSSVLCRFRPPMPVKKVPKIPAPLIAADSEFTTMKSSMWLLPP